jgi:pimeloyl-ACP methyl ester carboxylesterase
MRNRIGAVLVAATGALAFGATEAGAQLGFCDRAGNGRSCATLTVPLDRSGAAPGTVKLRIERRKAKRAVRPPLFLIADPGQSATSSFDSEVVDDLFGTEARSRDIFVMDLRGTGGSGALRCPALQRALPGTTDMGSVAACAAALGPRRDFYSAVDMADDIDAVRAALGAERIALYGTSYGTYVAQVYARRHPTRVDRLVLDSVVGPTGLDAFGRSSLAALPRAVESICGRRGCRRFMRDPGAVVTRLAARLEGRPLVGYVVDRRGRRQRATIDGQGLLELASVYPLVGNDLPAAVAAASRGDSAPLLRAQADLAWLLRIGLAVERARDNSMATAFATRCSDTAFPWTPTTALAARRVAVVAVADSLPQSDFAPFGRRTALSGALLDGCLEWPSSPRPAAALGPLPDVPALLLAGGADVGSPVADAQAVQALLPRSELLVVPGVSQSMTEWESGCAGRALRRFLAGGTAGRCGRPLPDVAGAIPPPPPTALRQLRKRGAPGRAGRTVTAVQRTLVDGFRALFFASFVELALREGKVDPDRPIRTGALRGGSYIATRKAFGLRRASTIPGVRVSGTLREAGPAVLRGSLTVRGRAAAHGRVKLTRRALSGTLGGRSFRVRFSFIERALGIAPSAARQAAIARLRVGPLAVRWPGAAR